MSDLTRWEPAREMMTLREAMDRLFNDAFTRSFPLFGDGERAWSSPAIDMYETDNEVVVKATLPSIKAEEVQIQVNGDVLTIRGETKQQEEERDKAWRIRERRWGAIERSVQLPNNIISE